MPIRLRYLPLASLLAVLMLFSGVRNSSAVTITDSLTVLLEKAEDPHRRFDLLIQITAAFHSIEASVSLEYGKRALRIAQQLNDKEKLAIAHTYMGRSYWGIGDQVNEINSYITALEIYRSISHGQGQITSHTHIGNVYLAHGKNDLALEHYQMALAISQEIGTKANEVLIHVQMGTYYSQIGELQKADDEFAKGLELAKKFNDQRRIVVLRSSMGNICYKREDWTNARDHLEASLKLRDEIGEDLLVYGTRLQLGQTYLHLNQPDKAIEQFQIAKSLSDRTKGVPWRPDVYKGFAEAYTMKGLTGRALHNLNRYSELKDSLFQAARLSKQAEVMAHFDFAERENKMKLRAKDEEIKTEQDKTEFAWQWVIYIASFLGILIIVFLSYIIRQKQKQGARLKRLVDTRTNELQEAISKLEVEHTQALKLHSRLLSAQINPHFIFNSLNSVQYYILENDAEPALNYIAEFSALMRTVLENSREMAVPLSQEVKFLEAYLKLEQQRFNYKFEFNIEIGEHIEPTEVIVPPMIFQPFIENAVVHGLGETTEGGKITISFTRKVGKLLTTISDNGIGRQAAAVKKKLRTGGKFESLGMSISNTRIGILNQLYSDTFEVDVEDLMNDDGSSKGTAVTVSFPLDL